jgi:hypothetical protein
MSRDLVRSLFSLIIKYNFLFDEVCCHRKILTCDFWYSGQFLNIFWWNGFSPILILNGIQSCDPKFLNFFTNFFAVWFKINLTHFFDNKKMIVSNSALERVLTINQQLCANYKRLFSEWPFSVKFKFLIFDLLYQGSKLIRTTCLDQAMTTSALILVGCLPALKEKRK